MQHAVPRRLQSVEAIRGLACLLVVVSHYSLVFWPQLHAFWGVAGADAPVQRFIHHSPFAFFYSGSAAVFIFFVLSGYILTHVALGRTTRDVWGLIVKRWPRLALPCIASTVLAWLAMELANIDYGDLSVWIAGYGDFDASAWGALKNGAWEVFVTGQSRYNPILWTMRIELIGSWLVFLLTWAMTRFAAWRAGLLGAAALAVVAAGMGGGLGEESADGLLCFVIGSALYLYLRVLPGGLSLVLLLAGLYLAGVHTTSHAYAWMRPLGEHAYLVGNALAGVLITTALIHDPHFARLASAPLLLWLGKVSFSVYLIHLCVLATLGVTAFHALSARGFGYHTAAWLACAFATVLIYAAAALFYRLVDAPAIRLSNLLRQRLLPSRARV